jgi:hypothetical protein
MAHDGNTQRDPPARLPGDDVRPAETGDPNTSTWPSLGEAADAGRCQEDGCSGDSAAPACDGQRAGGTFAQARRTRAGETGSDVRGRETGRSI